VAAEAPAPRRLQTGVAVLFLSLAVVAGVSVSISVLSPYITALMYALVCSIILNPLSASVYRLLESVLQGLPEATPGEGSSPGGGIAHVGPTSLLRDLLDLPRWLVTRHVGRLAGGAWAFLRSPHLSWVGPCVRYLGPTLGLLAVHTLDVPELGLGLGAARLRVVAFGGLGPAQWSVVGSGLALLASLRLLGPDARK
jgi:hypothetical protein